MGSESFFKVVAKNFDVLAGPVITLVYPLYASVKAIETKSPVDDQQWLTYWVLYSLITLFELTFAKMIEWLPFWSYAKLIFTCWLVLPYFSGATYVYQHYVRTLFVNQQLVNIWYVPQNKHISGIPDDMLSAAERYIEEDGPEAFEKLISKKTTLRLPPLRSWSAYLRHKSVEESLNKMNKLSSETQGRRAEICSLVCQNLDLTMCTNALYLKAERAPKSRISNITWDEPGYATGSKSWGGDDYSIHNDPRWS